MKTVIVYTTLYSEDEDGFSCSHYCPVEIFPTPTIDWSHRDLIFWWEIEDDFWKAYLLQETRKQAPAMDPPWRIRCIDHGRIIEEKEMNITKLQIKATYITLNQYGIPFEYIVKFDMPVWDDWEEYCNAEAEELPQDDDWVAAMIEKGRRQIAKELGGTSFWDLDCIEILPLR